jgi:amino acid transporter
LIIQAALFDFDETQAASDGFRIDAFGRGSDAMDGEAGHKEGVKARKAVANLLLGRRLANRESKERRIGALEGVPAMGLDGLGSSAYGPEAALTVLIPLGAASLHHIGWVMAPTVALLAVLFVSYRQTIAAYPNNGGAYIVARENLGTSVSLVAAAALMIDYVLNVAVGISAGVAALVSIAPGLHPYIIELCLGVLGLVTIVNLRGTLDAGRAFALPTYLFVASFAVIIGLGMLRAITTNGQPQPIIAPPALGPASEAVTLWLLLRAFASGCTAMTGVEAVSNGMSAFKEPTVKHGRRTLTLICVTLGLLLVSIAYLATAFRVGAMDQTRDGYQSVLSQLAQAVAGRGVLYHVAMGSLLCVLALSANTSFVDFPRLCRAIAEDGYLPKPFAVAGRRLVFSVGIIYLAACAGGLLVIFGGITDRLIPLFAIGAFLTFTLSQAGMVMHWLKLLRASVEPRVRREHQLHLVVNAAGVITTSAALLVIVIAKFEEGAWLTLLVIPLVIWMLRAIHGYYSRIASELRDSTPLGLNDLRQPIVLVTAERWDRLTDNALRFALTLSNDVVGVHLTQLSGPEAEDEEITLREIWKSHVEEPAKGAGLKPPRLMILAAQHRAMHEPVLKLARELRRRSAGRRIAVLIPEIVKTHWYSYLLHTHRAARLKTQLSRLGDPDLTVIAIPWRLSRT